MDAIRAFGVQPTSLEPANWSDAVPMAGVLGGLLYKPVAASPGFQRDDGSLEVFDEIEILLGEIATAATPSLLGWDILRYFRLELDGVNRTVLLQRL